MVRIEIRTVMFNNIRENSRVIYGKAFLCWLGSMHFFKEICESFFFGRGKLHFKRGERTLEITFGAKLVCCMECAESPWRIFKKWKGKPFSVCTSKIVKGLWVEVRKGNGGKNCEKGVKYGLLLLCKKPNPPSIWLRKTTRWKKEKAWKMSHDWKSSWSIFDLDECLENHNAWRSKRDFVKSVKFYRQWCLKDSKCLFCILLFFKNFRILEKKRVFKKGKRGWGERKK